MEKTLTNAATEGRRTIFRFIFFLPISFMPATSRTKANVSAINETVLKKKKKDKFLFLYAVFSVSCIRSAKKCYNGNRQISICQTAQKRS